jgi:enoyl-CoA hydratase/carnithine racemase
MPFVPTPQLTIESDGPVRILTLNRPEARNAFSDDMHTAMQEVWWELACDHDVLAVVLTGAGKAFSAGGDIPNFINCYDSIDYRRHSLRGARRLIDAMAEFPKPVVAAVNGPAMGLGASIAVSCDIVLMAETAYMADTHVNIGLVGGDGGPVMWPLLMSLLKAKELLLLGEKIPAAQCVELGLANHVVADEELMTRAFELAHRLAAQPRQAVQETKRAINLHLQQAISLVAPYALAAESESFGTDDIRKTIDTFKKG